MQKVNINKIKPNPKNPRIIKDDKFRKLVKSIEEFPQMLEKRPIVCFTDVDDKLVVLGGNMRLKAAKEVGLKELPVMLADDWTEEQKNEFLIKDNVGFGEWDWNDLQADWDTEQLEEWGLDMPDLEVAIELEAEEDDFDATPPEEAITVLGDLYEIGEHRLLCGDSTDSDQVAKLMNGQKADMVFTDPPYGVDYEGGTGRYANGEIKSKTSVKIKNDINANLYEEINPIIHLFLNEGAIYIWYADKFIKDVIKICDGFELRTIINWYKIKQGFGDMGSNYHSVSEPCLYLVKEKSNFNGPNNEINIWELQRPQKNDLHPTQKPIELPERAIKNSSKEHNIVLDLFLGSGSTMVASHQLKRKCYGMELDPKYCDVIVKRMVKLDPTLTVKRNGIDCKKDFE
jgi:site-specific DNA-methyltransferase (adenine-specific)